jgi:hypothetical protein
MNAFTRPLILIAFYLLFFPSMVNAQTGDEVDDWDNVFYYSNKLGWGSDNLRQTVLVQTRYNDNFKQLEQWFVEYAASFLITENFEITPDFRFTQKPSRREYRPGIGIIYKNLLSKSQIVHQVKWQYDFKENTADSHAARYAIFYNKAISEKILASVLAGGIYEWGDNFTGIWGIRAGFNVAYVFNKQHAVGVGWLYGLANTKETPTRWTNVGIPTFTLAINIRKDFKYLPAKYINF